jgi:outer membrane protein assembly factor BamB
MNTSRGGIRWAGYGSPPKPVRRMAGAYSPPIVVGNVAAYFGLGSILTVRNHRTGRLQWDAELSVIRHPDVQEAPAVVGDILCAVSAGGVTGFQLSTGNQIWQLEDEDVGPDTPSVADRTVFVGGENNWFHALDAATGTVRWRRRLAHDDSLGAATYGTAVADRTVFISCRDGLVRALDAATGKPRWPTVTGHELDLPVCVHGDVVIAASGDRMYGIDAATGERRWRRRLGDSADRGLALGGGSVVTCTRSSVCALAVDDGQVRWQTRLEGDPGAPSIAGDVVVVPSSYPHRLQGVLLQDGRRLWDVQLKGEPSCAPVIAGSRLLITAGESVEVFAFDRTADGEQAREIRPDGR